VEQIPAPTTERGNQFALTAESLKPKVPGIQRRIMAKDIPSKKAVLDATEKWPKGQIFAFVLCCCGNILIKLGCPII
jgi:hypothetical protein